MHKEDTNGTAVTPNGNEYDSMQSLIEQETVRKNSLTVEETKKAMVWGYNIVPDSAERKGCPVRGCCTTSAC